jgi:single-strand DNA-binding protein
MNTLRNQIQIIGLLGQKPELLTTTTGKKYTRFNVATTEKYTAKDGAKKEETTWHRITLWDKQAEIATQYLDKGSEVGLSGRMVNREYTDKDNIKRTSYEIIVTDMLLLGSKKGSANPPKDKELVTVDDNLPF